MDDDDEVLMSPTRPVDIPAKFIRQAFEHLQHTNARYVTFMFINEMVMDAVCAGVSTSTRRALPAPAPSIAAKPATSLNDDDLVFPKSDDLAALTDEAVLQAVISHSPLNTRQVCDALDIPRNDLRRRQRVHRVLLRLQKSRMIRVLNDNARYPKYVPTSKVASPSLPRRPFKRVIGRRDITTELVLGHLQTGIPLTSRTIGDLIGIPRPDAVVRSKITEVIGRLVADGMVRIAGIDGGRLYQLADPSSTDESALS